MNIRSKKTGALARVSDEYGALLISRGTFFEVEENAETLVKPEKPEAAPVKKPRTRKKPAPKPTEE